MNLEYLAMNGWQKFWYKIKIFFIGLPSAFVRVIKGIGKSIAKFFRSVRDFFVSIITIIKAGDWKTRMSFIIMGTGCFANKQIVRGILYLLVEIGFVLFMAFFGGYYLSKFGTLGETLGGPIFNEDGIQIGTTTGDNSLIILLYGICSILLICIFAFLYFKNIYNAYDNQIRREYSLPIMGAKKDFLQLLDGKFHITLMSLPSLGVIVFTILPLIFMVLIAFTSYDKEHLPPGNLFTWVGFDNFIAMFSGGAGSLGGTFWRVLAWTLTWAVFATATTYIGGLILALMINKKGVKFKKMYRGFFVITMAVPQFVTLLVISKFFATDTGLVNKLLVSWGLINTNILWLEDATLARIMVIVINMWIGIPYTMLMTSGILMNIPDDLYESARIDGASKVVSFFKITMPYMLFVTGPYLLTQFVGNINNFNVIFLLTGGKPTSPNLLAPAGETDLLITWLYNFTVNGDYMDYKMGSVIGILVFVVCAVISLLVYKNMNSVKNEEEFQ